MSKNSWIIGFISVVVIGLLISSTLKKKEATNSITPSKQTNQTEETEHIKTVKVSDNTWTKEDNLLTTELSYDGPVGTETHTLSISLDKNNTITDFTMSIVTPNKVSRIFQEKFIAELEPIIIGKPISEIKQIDTIAGARLTTDSFNNAISQL